MGKKFEFEHPLSFHKSLCNEAGPALDACTVYCKALIEELEIKTEKYDWLTEPYKNDFLTGELRDFLVDEGGANNEELVSIVTEMIDQLQDIEEGNSFIQS